jgi:hypothetical protein
MVGHSQIREKMAQVMEELPEDVTDSEDYAQIYGDRGIKVLRQCVEELYVELLATFEDFVEWYMQSTGSESHPRTSHMRLLIGKDIFGIACSRMKIMRSQSTFDFRVSGSLECVFRPQHENFCT